MSDEKKPDQQTTAEPAAAQAAGINPFDERPAAMSETAPDATESGEQSFDFVNDDRPDPEIGDIGAGQLKAVIMALQEELDKKEAELAEKRDQVLRAAAETENVRRRLEKEKQDTAKYAISKFAMDILTVGDNFQRAIAAVPKDAVDNDPALKTLLDGVVFAERDFIKALERHGVKSLDPAGQPFNPHHHQAVMEEENADVPTGTVLRVFQSGYLIDDRCLRPAMVVVARGGPKAAKPATGEQPATPDTGGSDASGSNGAD